MKQKFFKTWVLLLVFTIIAGMSPPGNVLQASHVPQVKLGNEVLLSKQMHLVSGKRVGLVTNQTGVNSQGKSLVDVFAEHPEINLVALYAPEHGIDGKAKAGAYVESTVHPTLGIPIYSLYGQTRKPSPAMMSGVDVLVFDMQDVGSRTYTYMSTMNYCMVAAKENNKPIVILDRPNPVGGLIVEGPVMEDKFITFVGVDNLPMAHGMTAGELALFFNRKIGANVTVVKMEGYTRDMVWQDTGLPWVQTSPNIPTIESAFGYMATGLGEGTGIHMRDKFKWIGGRGINAGAFANLLNNSGLPGVIFVPEVIDGVSGVRLNVTDYRTFNPARSGFFALAYAKQLTNFTVPKSGSTIVMFDKIMGTDKVGQWLDQHLSPQQILANYTPALNKFKEDRKQYLLYGSASDSIRVRVDGRFVHFDAEPFIDTQDRVIVPMRAIAEALQSNVFWNEATREVTVTKAGQKVVLTIGSKRALVDGQERFMDTVPVIRNGRTMIPARFISEYLGTRVEWSPVTKTVDINSY
jgi:uncharacterized protein YbbC (DUF1343 family)